MIPHEEKVFPIFEPHTEWISKGKTGVAVELGVKVCILEDQHPFILHHHVMEKQTDDQIAVAMATEAKKHFPTLNACNFDKGFHTSANQDELTQHLDQVTLPRKSKLSKERQTVEPAINTLEVHGLDQCPDHGIDGFKRYVPLAIATSNIHRMGNILWRQDVERERRTKERSIKHRRAA